VNEHEPDMDDLTDEEIKAIELMAINCPNVPIIERTWEDWAKKRTQHYTPQPTKED
jgi:hypothetical protein